MTLAFPSFVVIRLLDQGIEYSGHVSIPTQAICLLTAACSSVLKAEVHGEV